MSNTLFTDKYYYQLLEFYKNKIDNENIRIGLLKDLTGIGSGIESYSQIISNELDEGNGYTTGGIKITNANINGLELTCDKPTWLNSTFSGVKGAFVYDDTNENNIYKYILLIIDFEMVDGLSTNNSTFEIGLDNNILIKLK